MKTLLTSLVGATVLISNLANAVPWCHKGTIVQIADVTWEESHILANFTGTVPSGVADPDHYTTFTATHNYANTFAGGGGGFGGYSVPGSGQVKVVPYAPYSYTNMVPGYYDTAEGVQFKLEKCYTIAPMTHVIDFAPFELDSDKPIITKPFVGLEQMQKYWRTQREINIDALIEPNTAVSADFSTRISR